MLQDRWLKPQRVIKRTPERVALFSLLLHLRTTLNTMLKCYFCFLQRRSIWLQKKIAKEKLCKISIGCWINVNKTAIVYVFVGVHVEWRLRSEVCPSRLLLLLSTVW